jgi:hypothetical protein
MFQIRSIGGVTAYKKKSLQGDFSVVQLLRRGKVTNAARRRNLEPVA